MVEKVIHEVKFIETDDGYRIELKGDKENIKKMFDHGMGFGHKTHGWRHARKAWKHGPGFMMPPWMWCMGDEEAGVDEEAATSSDG
jgi:hypothetical protein